MFQPNSVSLTLTAHGRPLLADGGGLPALQHEVQRLLGRCLLRLQQYERLTKALVAHHKISAAGSIQDLKSAQSPKLVREKSIARAASMTLGTLVGELLGSYISLGEPKESLNAAPDEVEYAFSFAIHLAMSDDDFTRTQQGLKELVDLRNNLVHHFIDQHNLWTAEGCRKAQDSLVANYTRIDQYFEQLRGWAEHMNQAQRLAAEFVNSDTFRDLVVNGIAPDGTVHWPSAGIVRALREAADELATDGWTPVALAERWISLQDPEQQPARYGCSSWRQVIHESHLFELRYHEVDGQRAACYRAKEA